MTASANRPRVGVSSCLLGHPVRYDGKQKRMVWIAQVLPSLVDVVAICPEVGAGMPVPRPPIQVVLGDRHRLLVVGSKPTHTSREADQGDDCTDAMEAFINQQLDVLEKAPIAGFVFKARSPSCGLHDTPHFGSAAVDAQQVARGSGLWAAALCQRFPTLPVVDESDLQDKHSQEEFLARVFAFSKRLLGPTP